MEQYGNNVEGFYARSYVQQANEAIEKSQTRTKWANEARENMQLRLRWSKDAFEKAKK
jgi:hypothetical protein